MLMKLSKLKLLQKSLSCVIIYITKINIVNKYIPTKCMQSFFLQKTYRYFLYKFSTLDILVHQIGTSLFNNKAVNEEHN